ncbi:MAG: hypothetical protein U9O83_03510 [Campylobacterota bacterium]|nr:hypothetical protein [Campylobacterota bacterium]
MIQLKTLNKRIATRSQGVFYKPVVNEKEKEVDDLIKKIIIGYGTDYEINFC